MGSKHNPPKWWLQGRLEEALAEETTKAEERWRYVDCRYKPVPAEPAEFTGVKYDLKTEKYTIPEGTHKLNWSSWEYRGAEIKDPDGKIISSNRELFAGQEILVPTIFGDYSRSTVEEDTAGKLSTTATDGGSIFWLSKSQDDHLPEELRRNAWVSTGGANLKAIQRLELK
jgi:hypothetical protein